jgi:Na+-translocating ferredoxin:NAD+ oxidoreductase RnfC subunit
VEVTVDRDAARAIEKAGVVGAGGGGFPTHVKAAGRADTVLANGAECEPLLRADSELMVREPERVVRGLELVAEAVGATRTVIAVKSKNARAIAALERAASGARGIEVAPLDNVYPAGDEFLLVHALTGRVVPEGGIPPDVGVAVNNVTTLAQVADAVEGTPVTRRMVTVQGEVEAPGTFLAPIGTPIRDVIERAGGVTVDDAGVLLGGPMMGRLATSLDEPTTKVIAGVIVLPRGHRLITSREASESHVLRIARAACCQCLACTELCPRFLLGHALEPHRTVRAIQHSRAPAEYEHVTSAFLCCECGMCELFACPLEIQPRRILADLKAELSRRGIANPHRRESLSPDGVREYRQIPAARLVQRLGLSRYDREAPFDGRPIEPARVELLLTQHAGRPARAVVGEGERVLAGDVVGEIEEGSLGARVHASISGAVESVTEERVAIAA